MAQEKIKCPKCGAQFELTDVISQEIEATISQKYETQINTLKIEADVHEKQLKEQFKSEKLKIAEQARKDAAEALKIELEIKLAAKEKEIRASVDEEKKAVEEKARKQAEQAYSVELKDAHEQLNEL